MNRILSVSRIHLIAWRFAVIWGWAILASSFAINLLVWSVMDPADRATASTYGLVSIYFVTGVGFIQAMTQLFPFALGLSASRKAFYGAESLVALVQGLSFGLGLFVLERIETATGGWGMDLHFFGLSFMRVGNPVLQVLVYSVPFLLFAFLGLVWGAIHKRWGPHGIMAATLASVVLVGAGIFYLTWQDKWAAFGSWFADQSAGALFVGWTLLPTAALAAAGWLVVRRTVP